MPKLYGFRKVMSVINTVYFNFKFLPLNQAIHMPVRLSDKVYIDRKSKGKLKVIKDSAYGKIYIGYKSLNTIDERYERSVIRIDGTLVIRGTAWIAQGIKLDVRENAQLVLGDKFNSTGKSEIICFKRIVFEDDCTISWDTLFMDSDAHSIYNLNQRDVVVNQNKPILIGKHCWIGCRSTILKGVVLPKETIVACNSTITKSFSQSNLVIGGPTQCILKKDVSWDLSQPI